MKYVYTSLIITIFTSACGSAFDSLNNVDDINVQSSLSTNFSTLGDIPEGPDSCQTDLACQAQAIVNKIRTDNNLVSLTTSIECQEAAQFHAEDMALKNFFNHISQDGTTPAVRTSRFDGVFSGENIAFGQTNAKQVSLAWMNSKGHRQNILSSNHTTIGTGYALNNDGRPYWVQVFCN